MSEIWTPRGVHMTRATLPDGDVTLANGHVLGHDIPGSEKMRRQYRAAGHRSAALGIWYGQRTGMLVIAGVECTDRWGDLLHVSLSFRDRNPSWREIRLVKDAFYGTERDAMMVLPREADYINVHEHCFHLWETPEAWRMQ